MTTRRLDRSPILAENSACDAKVKVLTTALWAPGAQARLFADSKKALATVGLQPPAQITCRTAEGLRLPPHHTGWRTGFVTNAFSNWDRTGAENQK